MSLFGFGKKLFGTFTGSDPLAFFGLGSDKGSPFGIDFFDKSFNPNTLWGRFTGQEAYDEAQKQWDWQTKKYDENFKFQQEQYDYQKRLNAMQMQREDTAVQRRVADLKAAGLSPTLAAGSSASSTPVHASSAPQYEVGTNPKVEAAMFRAGLMKDMLGLSTTMLGNFADVSRTKAETELIRSQKGEQDIINNYLDEFLEGRNFGQSLDNDAKNMANSFNRLNNPALLRKIGAEVRTMEKNLEILDFDKIIKQSESARQVYYDIKAELENQLLEKNIKLSDLKAENVDLDSICKAYTLVYANDRGIPLNGLSAYQALYDLGFMFKSLFFPNDKNKVPNYKGLESTKEREILESELRKLLGIE